MVTDLEIGNSIKELREKEGLNQREFAEQIGVFSPDYLRKIERGDLKEPKYEYLIAIAKFCRVTVDHILGGDNLVHISLPGQINMNMQTTFAKEAINYLNQCARSIKKLDDEAYPAIKALEGEIEKHEDPETKKMIGTFESSNMAGA